MKANFTESTSSELAQLEDQGYVILRGVLTEEQRERYLNAVETLPNAVSSDTIDLFSLDETFLDLVDVPRVLALMKRALGDNIWVNFAHARTVRAGLQANKEGFMWHRDSQQLHSDLGEAAPRMALKVGFYLTRLDAPRSGQTLVLPGSHRDGRALPGEREQPADAIPIAPQVGDATVFDNRLIHSYQSSNQQPCPRHAVFVQYAYRWLVPMSLRKVDQLQHVQDPVRRQLLGLDQRWVGKRSHRRVSLG